MMQRRTYGQFCALARALDHVGDRWTLLIVRELLLGRGRFAELSEGLSGIPPTLLAERLRRMQEDGLVHRSGGAPRSKTVRYTLTEAGRELEELILAAIRWGARYMPAGPGDDRIDDRWGVLAFRALLEDDRTVEPQGAVEIVIGGEIATVTVGPRGRHVVAGPSREPGARLRGALPEMLAVCAGAVPADAFVTDGSIALARDVLRR